MHFRYSRSKALLSCFIGLAFFAAGCKKQVAAPPPAAAPAPAPVQPTVTINASTTSINPGESVTLTWSSTDATDLNISPEIGKVAPQGSTSVSPTESTTYQITATGPGGSAQASVRVTVTAPAPPAAAPSPGIDELFMANVRDAFFDFNKSDLRADAREALTKTAEFLRAYPQVRASIEGYCDERGSTEYNLGLGQRRAASAKEFLVSLGISADRLTTVSYGKEKQFCTEHTEACWQQNRRAHIVRAQ
ncbi:MAG: peptidoglycan-associated lipoprotein Pal [Candidatus Acidiferrales bacterium]